MDVTRHSIVSRPRDFDQAMTATPAPAPFQISCDHFQEAVIMAVHSRSLLVRSCAGSGKSSVLAARCASLIASGADPERTILLTFSVRSKLDLESKICEVLPTGRPRVLTHHANALAILRKAGCTSRVIASKSQRKIMRAILASRSHDPPTQDAVRQGLSLVARVKGSGSLPAHDSSERHIVEEYQRMLRERGEIDFEDMVLSAAHVLRQAASASTASAFPAKPFDHLLLDEAQDMSASQIQLLQLLAPHGSAVVTAVGDSDQQIYSWRGSRVGVLSEIATFWGCDVLSLPTNYRCGQGIVRAAKALIEGSSLRESPTPLLTAPRLRDTGSVHVHACGSRVEELQLLVSETKAAQQPQSSSPGSIAVLCRTRAQVAEVVSALKLGGVRIVKQAEGDARGELKALALDVLSYLSLCVSANDDVAFETALQLPSRPGFAIGGGPSQTEGRGLFYLRAVQHQLAASARRLGSGSGGGGGSGGSDGGGATPSSLLGSAQFAASRGFPSVQLHDGSGNSSSLTKVQQTALRDLLSIVQDTRQRALQMSPYALLVWLANRVELPEHLEKARKAHGRHRRAFTVRVPGETLGHRGGSEGDDDDASSSDDEPEDELGNHWGSLVAQGDGSASPALPPRHDVGATVYRNGVSERATVDTSRLLSQSSPSVSRALSSLLRTAQLVAHRTQFERAPLAPRASVPSSSRDTLHLSGEASGHHRKLEALGRFVDEMLISSHEEEEEETSASAEGASAGGRARQPVLATTLHQAKGLEFDTVFMPFMVEGSLPCLPRGVLPNSLEYVEKLEEERRLCYVGFTRARRSLTLSWASLDEPSPSLISIGERTSSSCATNANKPSRFLPRDANHAQNSADPSGDGCGAASTAKRPREM
jgi:superfamily I DNA/RNA helicase